MARLPRWAEIIKNRHPDGEMPTRDNPIPSWLEQEARDVPLWYIIREARNGRSSHPFLVYNEINRQPGQWNEILADHGPDVGDLAQKILDAGVEKLYFTGCGSAFFTAIYSAYIFNHFTGLDARAIESFELAQYFPPAADPSKILVAGHSGTGGSIETIQALQAARERGCHTLALTNTAGSPVVDAASWHLTYVTRQECGPCISVVSTRILLVAMLALEIARRRGDSRADLSSLESSLDEVVRAGETFLRDQENKVRDLAKLFKDACSFFLVGSGPNYFSAREGTLKIEEQAIVVGKAYRTGDFHHDALSLVGPDKVVIVIEANAAANERIVDVLRAAREAGSPTVAVTYTDGDTARDLRENADHTLHLGGNLPESIAPVPMTLVFQLLGYYLGVERGYNPDTLRTDHWPNAKAWLTAFPLGTH